MVAEFNHLHFPHTQALIDGRWVFGYMGFALLGPWQAGILGGILCLPLASEAPFLLGLVGNLLYAIPGFLLIRIAHRRMLAAWGPDWRFGLGWLFLILVIYQVFHTPAIWGMSAFMLEAPVLRHVLEGWETQPLLLESVLVGTVSSSLLLALLNHRELAERERRLDHFHRVLLGIRNVNQLIVSEEDPRAMVDVACRNLTEHMGYRWAWVGLLDETGETLTATASSAIPRMGDGTSPPAFLNTLPPCARRALESEGPVVIRDPSQECLPCPLIPEYGEWSGLSKRLRSRDRTYGVMAVAVPRAYANDEEEHSLFSEVTEDLAFALGRLEDARALELARNRYREIYERSRDGFVMVDLKGRIMDANQAFCDLLGYSLEELRAMKDFYEITPETWREWEAEEIWENRLMTRGHSGLYQKEYVRKDGTVFPVELQSYAARDDTGEMNYLWATVRDITERRESEEALEASEQKWREYIQNAPHGVFLSDASGRYQEVNPAASRITGFSQEELTGMAVWDLVADESRDVAEESFRALLRGESFREELAFRHKSGEVRWWSVSAVPLGEGRFLGFTLDVTARKRTEDELRRFKTIFDTASFGAAIADLSGNLSYVNESFASIHGYKTEELVGNSIRVLHSEGQRSQVDEALRDLIIRGHFGPQEIGHLHRDGSVLPMLMTGVLVRSEDGVPLAMATTALDLRKQKTLESQLRQAQKMESVGRLAGGVAHDFNNMLNVILGYAEFALDSLPPRHPAREDIQEIRKAGEHSADLTRQLLAFARQQPVVPQVLDLNETIRSALKMLTRLIGEDIDLVWCPADGLAPVRMDPVQIDQVLANLVVNARDAIGAGPGGEVVIQTDQVTLDEEFCLSRPGSLPGQHALLTVSDDGSGMDEETKENIFEPFFTTKGLGRGTGLGLATVFGIVKQNEGYIDVDSEPEQGTTFRIYLPSHLGEAGAESRREGQEGALLQGSETVLLVEDEAAVLSLGTKMLERLGYGVLAASTPSEAIGLAREHEGEIHLLLTDVVMPEMNGRELVDHLLPLYPNLKPLFMSGYTADVIAHQGVLDEGVHFIQKPFSLHGLGRKVREALDESEG